MNAKVIVYGTVFLAVVLASTSIALVPPWISFQARLSDNGGQPVTDGDYAIRFTIYDAPADGNALWTENHPSVTVYKGIFTVLLGSITPFGDISSDQVLYLGIAVEGDDEMIPRQPLSSAPFAFEAASVSVGAIHASMLAGLSVTTEKIAPGAITTEKVATGSITADLIVGGTGSNLDADRLDGLDSSAFMPAGTDYWVNVTGDSMTGPLGITVANGNGLTSVTSEGTGVSGESTSTLGLGVYGYASATTGSNMGVIGVSDSTAGCGVLGQATAGSGNTWGIRGDNNSTSGSGVTGWASAASGTTYGVVGQSASSDGTGVYGYAPKYGIYGHNDSTSGTAVYGNAVAVNGTTYGVRGKSVSADGYGVYGYAEIGIAVKGEHGTGNYGVLGSSSGGVFGQSSSGNGIHGVSDSGNGVYGYATGSNGIAVKGDHETGNYGVLGDSSQGVFGHSLSGVGVSGVSGGSSGVAIKADHSNGNLAWLGYNGGGIYAYSASGYAGYFSGSVFINGDLSKASGSFVQPHAKDPSKEIKYAFFEGPEHAVFLRGTARLSNGMAVITLPEHFSVVAAQEGIEVQVTPYSADTYGLAVIERSRERIVVKELKGGCGNFEFSYYVTGIRQGFEAHEPVVANTHFKPRSDETAENFTARFSKDDMATRALRSMLISNGILTVDGKLNMAMTRSLGWRFADDAANIIAPLATAHK